MFDIGWMDLSGEFLTSRYGENYRCNSTIHVPPLSSDELLQPDRNHDLRFCCGSTVDRVFNL